MKLPHHLRKSLREALLEDLGKDFQDEEELDLIGWSFTDLFGRALWSRLERSKNEQQECASRYLHPDALDELEPLLEEIRRCPDLVEQPRGLFWSGEVDVLHFHRKVGGGHEAHLRVEQDRGQLFDLESEADRLDLLHALKQGDFFQEQ